MSFTYHLRVRRSESVTACILSKKRRCTEALLDLSLPSSTGPPNAFSPRAAQSPLCPSPSLPIAPSNFHQMDRRPPRLPRVMFPPQARALPPALSIVGPSARALAFTNSLPAPPLALLFGRFRLPHHSPCIPSRLLHLRQAPLSFFEPVSFPVFPPILRWCLTCGQIIL